MGETRDDDARKGGHDSGKKHPGKACDGAQVSVEEHGDQQAGSGSSEVGVVERRQCGDGRGVKVGPEDGEETREPNATRGDGERSGEADLPDVEKTEPVAKAVRAVDLAQKCIRTAGARKGCAKFGPDQAVSDGDDGAQHPRPDGEPVAGCGDDQRQRDEGTNADHLQHVEEHGRAQADAALKMGGVGRGG